MVKILPVKKNEEYIVKVEATSSEGNGIARIDGYTVFVPHTIAGDTVRILIVKTKSSYGYGKLTEIIEPSGDRQAPICNVFEKCGGCQLMHMKYAAQLKLKQEIVKNNLIRIGGLENAQVNDIVGMEYPYEYRNKMIFPVGHSEDGAVCGFYAQRSHRIIPLSQCHIGASVNTGIISAVTAYMKECGVSAYDEIKNKGTVRRVFTRKGVQTGEVMVVLSIYAKHLPHQEVLIDKLKAVSENIVSIIININCKQTNLVLGEKNITIYGKDFIEDVLCGIRYTISPHSFFQINPAQTEKLYAKAIEFADLSNKDTVMDIYCGIGTISLLCAKRAKRVIGVEIVEKAIEDAKENAARNGISNVAFYADNAENIVPKLIEQGETPDVVILDPPRKGSDEKTLAAIVKAQPKRVVYVSCDSATLSRDLHYLSAHGYELIQTVPFDLFPHTVHVESIVSLQRQNT